MLRPATRDDLEPIAALYAHFVEHSVATFDLQPPSLDAWRTRFDAALETGHPWLVQAGEDGGVDAYATTSMHRAKAAYARTVESTVYVAAGSAGRGLGREVYEAVLREAAVRGFHVAVAGVTLPNPASTALHERLGFAPVGVFRELGHKFGAWHDVGWWQLRLDGLRDAAGPA